jgi:hypothetical protein
MYYHSFHFLNLFSYSFDFYNNIYLIDLFQMNSVINKIQYNIIKYLNISSSRRQPLYSFFIEVSKYMEQLLIDRFQLSKEWMSADFLIENYVIQTHRFFNSGTITSVKKGSLKMKLKRKRTIKYNNGLMISSQPTIEFKFIKIQSSS